MQEIESHILYKPWVLLKDIWSHVCFKFVLSLKLNRFVGLNLSIQSFRRSLKLDKRSIESSLMG